MTSRAFVRRSRLRDHPTAIAILLIVGSAGEVNAQAAVPNYQGLWWASPAESQSGWGFNIAHQGEVIFVTWFTYLNNSNPRFLYMTAFQQPDGSFSGTLAENTGPPYSAVPFDATAVQPLPFTAHAELRFTSESTGTLSYDATGTPIVQQIEKQVFGPPVTCVWGAQADLSTATNYTDLWWAGPSESGWGVNLSHQGSIIFATWFTYTLGGFNTWFSSTLTPTAPGRYEGLLRKTNGPGWGTLPWDKASVSYVVAGALILEFLDGNHAHFTQSVNSNGGAFGTSILVKDITRQVFRPPGTVCH
jgi:hypothetical protein